MNKTQLQTNNTRLASLIDELKGKAAGSGGAVETCTVTIVNARDICYIGLENGNIVTKISEGTNDRNSSHTIQVCKNTPITCVYMLASVENPAFQKSDSITTLSSYSSYVAVFVASADGSATFYMGGSGVD